MTPTDVEILIQQGEGTTLEFKEALSPSSFAREIVALANTIGGKVLLGVRDDGSVKGIGDSNVLRARVQDVARNCDPPVKVLAEPVNGVFVVHVRESDAKPVQCGDGFFWRQGAVTQKLGRDEIRDFFRAEGVIRFDLSPCPRFRYPEDFDRGKFDTWLRYSNITAGLPVEDVLVNIEAAERNGNGLLFRNAGVLFFARNVRHFFPEAYVTCLLGRGTDKVHVLDRKDFDGGIVADVVELPRFRGHLSCWEEEVSAMPKSRPPYAAEFRRQMVELVRSGRTPEALAREFEPSAQAIRNWVAQAGRDAGERTDGLRTGEREEMRRLRRENRRLREEREILAKATAWFARETGSGGSTGS